MGDELAVRPVGGNVVFVHSCFRSASTWFWSRLRSQRGLCCYYEVFNEQLEHLSLADLPSVRPDTWRSHHPDSGPYLTEYASLLGTLPGLEGFPVESPLGSKFIGAAGVEGPPDREVRYYVRTLVDAALASHRVPVITGTRTLGRVAGLRAAFGGTHVLLVRNLFEQWNSVSGQLRAGNDYFLRMIFQQLNFGRQDGFFAYLMTLFNARDQSRFENWARDENADRVFCCYVASRVYLLLVARRHCDLVVDISALGNAARRAATEDALSRVLGVGVDLSDFEQRVDYPQRLVESPTHCRALLGELVERALAEANASDAERDFAGRLVDAVWEAHKWFAVYTAGARELIEEGARRGATLLEGTRLLESRVRELEAQVVRCRRELAGLQQTAEARRLHAESVEAHLRNCQRDLAELEARLVEARQQ